MFQVSTFITSVVELSSVWWTLSCESEVCILATLQCCVGSVYSHTCRLIHAFTAAGVLPSQYKRMSAFAEMGAVGKNYIDKGFINLVHMCTMELLVAIYM